MTASYTTSVLRKRQRGEDEDNPQTKAGNNDIALTMTDLETNPEYYEPIKAYMIDRKGKHFARKNPEEVVDAFTRHMRFFNTNEAVTLSEGLFISKANEDVKARAGEAYKVYDKLGNVFVNDGFYGAVDGVSDYIQSILTSPSTYLGFGVGKGVSMVGGKAAVKATKMLAQKAYMDAFRRGGKEAAVKAFNDVITSRGRKKALATVGITGAGDTGVAVLQDIGLQDTQIEAGSREERDYLQTSLSGVGALIGTSLATATLPKTKGISGIDTGKVRKARIATKDFVKIEKGKRKEFSKKVKDNIKKMFDKDFADAQDPSNIKGKDYRAFRTEARKGKLFFVEEYANRVKEFGGQARIVFDDDTGEMYVEKIGAEGVSKAGIFEDNILSKLIGNKQDGTYILDDADSMGIDLPFNMNRGGKLVALLKSLDPEEHDEISKFLYQRTGITLGEATDFLGKNIGSTVARSFSNAGRSLLTIQGIKLNRDAGIVQGALKKAMVDKEAPAREMHDEIVRQIEKKPKRDPNILQILTDGGYIQNVWKRLLVSAPQTTAANVYGWTQYYTANSVAELFQGGILGLLSLTKGGPLTEAGMKDLRQAKALFDLQFQKIRNLADPYSTYDTYMELLEGDPTLKARLFDTFAGGIDRTAKRFDIKETNKYFKTIESLANAAGNISGVKLQDTLTKSQMFINGIDKQLRLQKGLTFKEVLQKGDLSDMTEDVVNDALDETMQSVFSFDYTRGGSTQFFRDMAQTVEGVSNTPGLGFLLPFGRFMNNVVAFTYNWNPVTGLLPVAQAIAKGNKLDATQSLSRAMVGFTAIKMAMDFQEENERKGLAWNEVEGGSGDVVDITNVFPLSLLMVGARFINTFKKGGKMKDLAEDLGKQMAIGQVATDLSFGNDLNRIYGFIENLTIEGDNEGDYFMSILDNVVLPKAGNIIAGFTRPLDPINRLVGAATGTDNTIDRRIADSKGILTLSASKYLDNIIETFRGKLQDRGFQEKRVASREGPLFDPSPIRTLTGYKIKQPRTNADIMFGMVNIPNWRSSMYTGIPEHDDYMNRVLSPAIEQIATELLDNPLFMEAPLRFKRQKVDFHMKRLKKEYRQALEAEGMKETEPGLDYRRNKLDRRYNNYILQAAKAQEGITGSIRNLTTYELDKLEKAAKDMQELGAMDIGDQ